MAKKKAEKKEPYGKSLEERDNVIKVIKEYLDSEDFRKRLFQLIDDHGTSWWGNFVKKNGSTFIWIVVTMLATLFVNSFWNFLTSPKTAQFSENIIASQK